jgi:hypothetical protein
MASISFDELLIHDAGDLSSYVALVIENFSSPLAGAGRFVSVAGGRRRLLTTGGTFRSVQITAELVSADDLATLEGWARQLLLLRAPQGLLIWGSYLEVTPQWSRDGEADAVSFTFNEITHSIEV